MSSFQRGLVLGIAVGIGLHYAYINSGRGTAQP